MEESSQGGDGLNTFFRAALYLSFALIIFNITVAFISGFNVFPVADTPGTGEIQGDEVVEKVSDNGFTGMEDIWSIIITGTVISGAGAVLLAWLTHSTTPIGVYLFGAVFWTSYLSTFCIFSTGGFIPAGLLNLFHVGSVLLFIAAVIGMLTGSG